jgi:hypothetical protein
MRMVVAGPGEEVMMIFVSFEGDDSPPQIPELYGLVMASHETVLFIGIVVDVDDVCCS